MKIKQKIKNYFFEHPTEKLRVRQIERKVNVPFPSVVRYVKELENEEILKSELIANVKLFSANRSQIFFLEKRLYNIKRMYKSGLINYIKKEYSNPLIILFGSYSKGEDIETSDIDLYIESPVKKVNVKEFESILNRNIQIIIHRKISEIENKKLINNILNGVVLNGNLEVY